VPMPKETDAYRIAAVPDGVNAAVFVASAIWGTCIICADPLPSVAMVLWGVSLVAVLVSPVFTALWEIAVPRHLVQARRHVAVSALLQVLCVFLFLASLAGAFFPVSRSFRARSFILSIGVAGVSAATMLVRFLSVWRLGGTSVSGPTGRPAHEPNVPNRPRNPA